MTKFIPKTAAPVEAVQYTGMESMSKVLIWVEAFDRLNNIQCVEFQYENSRLVLTWKNQTKKVLAVGGWLVSMYDSSIYVFETHGMFTKVYTELKETL